MTRPPKLRCLEQHVAENLAGDVERATPGVAEVVAVALGDRSEVAARDVVLDLLVEIFLQSRAGGVAGGFGGDERVLGDVVGGNEIEVGLVEIGGMTRP
jgi:hypothetical protein